MTRLQNPISKGFESLNDNLREVTKGQKNFGKALDKASRTSKPLLPPTSTKLPER